MLLRRISLRIFLFASLLVTLPLFPLTPPSYAGAEDISLRKVSALIRSEKYNAALDMLQRTPDGGKGRNFSRISFLKGICHMGLKQWKEAKLNFVSIRDVFNTLQDYVDLYIIRSDYHLENYSKAIKRASRFPSIHPLSRLLPEVLLTQIKTHIAIKEWKKAQGLLKGMLTTREKAKNAPELFRLFHEALLHEGKIANSFEALQKIYYYFPGSPETKFVKTKMKWLKEKNPELSFPLPGANMIYARLARLAGKGKYAEVIKESRLLLADPKYSDSFRRKIYLLRGRCYRATKSYSSAVEVYKEFQRKYPKDSKVAESMYYVSRIQWNQGKLDEALETGKLAIKKFPKNRWVGQIYFVMGGVMENKGDPYGAMEYYKKILVVSSEETLVESASWRIAWLYYLDKDYGKSLHHLERMTKMYPLSHGRGRPLYWAAVCAEKLNMPANEAGFLAKLFKSDVYGFYGYLGKTRLFKNQYQTPFRISSPKSRRILLPKISFSEKLQTPELPPKASYHLAKSLELSEMDLFEHAGEELGFVAGKVNKRNLDKILWLGQLYYKVGVYKPLLSLMNNYLITVLPKNRVELPELFRQLYYPPAYMDLVAASSIKYGVDPCLALALIRQESSFDEKSISGAGAIGLMQLMPETGKRIFYKIYKGKKFNRELLYDPELNIDLGIYHLSELLKKNKGDMIKVLIAYNAGIKRVTSWEKRFKGHRGEGFIEMIPYGETRKYVKKVLRNYYNYKRLYGDENENLSLSFKKL